MLSKNLAQRAFQTHQTNLQLGMMITWREDVGDDCSRCLGFIQADNLNSETIARQDGTVDVRASEHAKRTNRSPVVMNETWAHATGSSNDSRSKYTNVYTSEINREQKAVAKYKRDSRKLERQNRLRYGKDRDASDVQNNKPKATSMLEYLEKQNTEGNGS
jgi:DNA polymerase II small subunit/DNA polymerase delta subunit B